MFVYESFVLLYVVRFPCIVNVLFYVVRFFGILLHNIGSGSNGSKTTSISSEINGAREESLSVGLTLNSHGGYPCNDSIVANTQNPKPTNKIMQTRFKVVNSTR
jgi:hypothetical protein